MILEEVIKHYEEVVKDYEKIKCIKAITLEELKYEAEYRQVAEWLKELKQLREQTRWIPVSERLPKNSGYYWCTFGGTNRTGIAHYITELDAKKIFDNPEEYAGWESQNVIAWIQLPESYNAESEGEE